MFWRVEVKEKEGFFDAVGHSVKKDILELGFAKKIKDVKFVQVYLLEGDLKEADIRSICDNLLIDPITQEYYYNKNNSSEKGYRAVEIAYNAGVMDPVEDSAKKAILDLGIKRLRAIKTAKRYLLKGKLSDKELYYIAENILYNKVIQHVVIGESSIPPEGASYQFKLKTIDMLYAGDNRLKELSKQGQLFLNLEEMKTIKQYFKKLKRNPTDCELETIAQTWSEHCKHKTFRGKIEYREEIRNSKSETKNKKY